MKKRIFSLICMIAFMMGDLIDIPAQALPQSSAAPITPVPKANKRSAKTQQPPDDTLPQQLSYSDYLQYIAQELNWVPTKDPYNLCHGHYLQPTVITENLNPLTTSQSVTQITATGPVTLRPHGVSELTENVVVTQPGRMLTADKAYIYRNAEGKISRIRLEGHVHLQELGELSVSDEAILILNPNTVTLTSAAYHVYRKKEFPEAPKGDFHAWGVASSFERNPNKVVTLRHATYSTCSPEHPVWQLSAQKLVLDKNNETGTAYGSILKVQRVPLLYIPYYTFPYATNRKSGVLVPYYGNSSVSGNIFGWPIYWNMAPNYDMVITPTYYGERGFEGSAQFRYLTETSSGELLGSFFPDDTLFGNFRTNAINTYSNASRYNPDIYDPYLDELRSENNQRGFFSMTNYSHFRDQWKSRLYLNFVSDPYYFTDIVNNNFAPAQTNQLTNLGQIDYESPNWLWDGYFEGFQTLHLITQITNQNQAINPYMRLPTTNVITEYPDLLPHTNFESSLEFTDFQYQSPIDPDKPNGQRLHARPGLQFPFDFAKGYVHPEALVDATGYAIQNPFSNQGDSQGRALPMIDVDSGLFFNKSWGNSESPWIQTFEPRLYYLYIPYQNQDSIPNFDSFLLPFYYDQWFSLNEFEGYDRIQNANRFTGGFASELVNSDGASIATVHSGIAYYLQQPRVCLVADCIPPTSHFSPFINDLTIHVTPHINLSGNFSWDTDRSTTNNAGASMSYHDDPNKIISLGYVYVHQNPDALANFSSTEVNPNTFSATSNVIQGGLSWPLLYQWTALGYLNYDIAQSRPFSYFGGLSYESCCWGLRFVAQRSYVQTTLNSSGHPQNEFDNRYYVEFILKGLGNFDTSGTEGLLQRSIPGYH